MGDIKHLPGGSKNKILYLIKINKINSVTNAIYYISSKIDCEVSILRFVGFEIPINLLSDVSTYDKAVEYVNNNSIKITELILPWNRVISVENITYKPA